MVVLPAPSRPRMRILLSFVPNSPENKLIIPPMAKVSVTGSSSETTDVNQSVDLRLYMFLYWILLIMRWLQFKTATWRNMEKKMDFRVAHTLDNAKTFERGKALELRWKREFTRSVYSLLLPDIDQERNTFFTFCHSIIYKRLSSCFSSPQINQRTLCSFQKRHKSLRLAQSTHRRICPKWWLMIVETDPSAI